MRLNWLQTWLIALNYDLSPIWIETKNQASAFVQQTEQEIECVELNANLIQQFDHVLYW
jgi:hypothetical protein